MRQGVSMRKYNKNDGIEQKTVFLLKDKYSGVNKTGCVSLIYDPYRKKVPTLK